MSRVWFEGGDRGWFIANQGVDPPGTGIEFVVGRTVNGGTDWTLTAGPPHGGAGELFFVDDRVGWATHGWVFGTRLLSTRDGGLSWAVQVDSPEAYLTDIYFSDPLVGWMRGASDNSDTVRVSRTVDGGVTWDVKASFARGLGPVSFLGPAHAWLATRYPHGLMATVDGGDTWRWTPGGDLAFLHFASPDVGWAGAYEDLEAVLYRTEDGGGSWMALPTVDVGSLHALGGRSDFLNDRDVWVLRGAAVNRGRNELIGSQDGGATWESLYVSSSRINDIHRIDRDTAWLGGETLLHTTDAGRTWMEIEATADDGAAHTGARSRRIDTWAAIRRHATPFGPDGEGQ
ncbi:hypothetical protein HN371_17625 [Candidatus Poribacteria bacterium]|nr:hypothetical protein [Candidatus Poribacteria bacterium]MBT5532354.1 hypothetical protein [Candidatus Poribacteria bacterium]MBT5714571.1 hypothetical protein [Candidatus Poribacteria bacterium]MBT7100195.1 hypothetical protein [Candidatus Poribacteria bacterium]MBT7808564.1 hypothetical protein [Candidatus Poribacteria bacterium]